MRNGDDTEPFHVEWLNMGIEKFEFLNTLAERLHGSASARTIYGDPVEAAGKTIIPVARVAYGLGGGYEPAPKHGVEHPGWKRGEGGGGGIMVHPLGVVEVTREYTRFIPLHGTAASRAGWAAAALLIGFVAGKLYADSVR